MKKAQLIVQPKPEERGELSDVFILPASEAYIIKILARLGMAHGPAIARASDGMVSLNSVYNTLGRLEEKKIVNKRIGFAPAGDIKLKRAFYQISMGVTVFNMNLTELEQKPLVRLRK